MKRIFAVVIRDMTEKTSVCIFPWEMRLMEHIHGQDVKQVTIDELCATKGSVKAEKVKLPHAGHPDMKPEFAPSTRDQLLAMAQVDPENDPTEDPQSEYARMVEKYGMDKEVKLPVVTRVYGEFTTGHFTSLLRDYASGKINTDGELSADSGSDTPPAEMSVAQLRDELSKRGVKYGPKANHAALVELLVEAMSVAA